MKNRITIYVQFDYRGETLCPAITIDLDQMMQEQGKIPVLYPLLARENGIGLYSYELEVMESLPLQARDAEGLAADFVEDQLFDQSGFEMAWQNVQAAEQMRTVALKHLEAELLDAHPEVMAAMAEAYQLGQSKS